MPLLASAGHGVIRLIRGREGEPGKSVSWDPKRDVIDASQLEGIDAVVHLAGEPLLALRWTAQKRARIRDSRVKGTRLLASALSKLNPPPPVLVAASAIGYYGDRGSEILTEDSSPGRGFLAEVAVEWEAASQIAADVGVRVVRVRSGIVLGAGGGVLRQMLPPFKLGVGGPVGSGKQYVSWISLEDAVRCYVLALENDEIEGPVNAVSPNPVTNREFAQTLGKVLSRPTFFSVPAFAVRQALGEMADETVLVSSRVEPRRLLAAGYQFKHPDLEPALRAALG